MVQQCALAVAGIVDPVATHNRRRQDSRYVVEILRSGAILRAGCKWQIAFRSERVDSGSVTEDLHVVVDVVAFDEGRALPGKCVPAPTPPDRNPCDEQVITNTQMRTIAVQPQSQR